MGASGRNLLTIGVGIDGKGPFQFVVDTGADRSVVSDAVARQLDRSGGGTVMVEGVVRTIEALTVRIAELIAGPARRQSLALPVLPQQQLHADGYLGLDVINGYRLSLDFQRNELRLLDPLSAWVRGPGAPNEVPIRLAGNAGHLRAFNCVIDGVRSVAFIDTGAEISVGNPLLYEALAERDSGYVVQETIPLTGVTGGVVEGRITHLKSTKLGGLTIEDSRIAIANLQIFRLWEVDDRPALLIGMNWLHRFNRVSIDYGRKELRFDLTARLRPEKPLPCGSSEDGSRYLIGSPNTIPRPSVAT
jgi:predicted aspartyl protease